MAIITEEQPTGCCGHGKQRITKTLILSFITVTGCNAMLCGYNMVVLNTPREAIAAQINHTYISRGSAFTADDYSRLEMLSNTLFLIIGAFGSLVSGFFADRFGSKTSIWFSDFAFVLGSVAAAMSYQVPELLLLGRALSGFGYGVASCSASTYLAEIAPKHLRGLLCSGLPFGLVGGIVLGQAAGLPSLLGTSDRWPYLFAVSALAASVSLVTLPFCPESPRFLYLTRRNEAAARESLSRLQGEAAIELEIAEFENERLQSNSNTSFTLLQLVRCCDTRTALILSCALQISQQLAGSTAVFMYCESIFKGAGLQSSLTPYAVLGTGLVSLVCIVPGMVLLERVGRRQVLFASLATLFVMLVSLTLSVRYQHTDYRVPFLSVAFVLLFCAAFAFGLGPLPAVIPPELFRQEARGRAYAVAKMVNSLCMLVQGALYEFIAKALHEYVFLLFAAVLLVSGVYFYLCLPETRGKTFEEVQVVLAHVSRRRKSRFRVNSVRATSCESTSTEKQSAIASSLPFSSENEALRNSQTFDSIA